MGRTFKVINNIDFNDFKELVGRSCIGDEIVKVFQCSVSDLLTRESSNFLPTEDKDLALV